MILRPVLQVKDPSNKRGAQAKLHHATLTRLALFPGTGQRASMGLVASRHRFRTAFNSSLSLFSTFLAAAAPGWEAELRCERRLGLRVFVAWHRRGSDLGEKCRSRTSELPPGHRTPGAVGLDMARPRRAVYGDTFVKPTLWQLQ